MKDIHTDLSSFKKLDGHAVVAKSDSAWNKYGYRERSYCRNYTPEEIDNIINNGTLAEQQTLSRVYFDRKGLYKRILLHYATVLAYRGILIPNPSFGKKLSTPHISKRYYSALAYINKMHLEENLTRISLQALIYGSYYGVIQSLSKDEFVIFDLPQKYCRSRFRDLVGNDIVEFDVSYFNTITDEDARRISLKSYPKIIRTYYEQYNKRPDVHDRWVKLPSDVGICFTFFDDGMPMLLSVIPATIQYDDAVDTERERELEEIRKIIVQKIPHLQDGSLLFEPDEAVEMHAGAVNMMKGNKNLSILTTYADVDSIVSKTSADNVSASLEKMLQNVYSEGGTSSQLFSPTGTQALPTSILNDMSFMMILGNKYSNFISHILNTLFSNSNIDFTYRILPVGLYNQSDFITDSFKLAQSGYSFLLPSLGIGINQFDLTNLKELENDVLKLQEVLIPLSSAYTNSGTGEVGAPEKKLEDKAKKTIQNEDAIDRQGQDQGGSE